MSIRPIDMQAYVPKVEQLGRQNQSQQERLQGETQSFLQNLSQEINLKQHQVQNTNKTEQEKIKRENKEKEKKRKQKQRNQLEPNKGSNLDITT